MYRLIAIALVLAFSSCKKNEGMSCGFAPPTAIAPASEVTYLSNWLTANNVDAIQHSSGAFYTIIHQGNGSAPTVCSNITVKYIGRILGGNMFDFNQSVNGIKFVLGNLLKGWQYVMPLMNTGAKLHIYIPPSLGYADQVQYDGYGNVLIPADSYLDFEIELLDVQ